MLNKPNKSLNRQITTKELILLLSVYPYDVPVYINNDPEGIGEEFELTGGFFDYSLSKFTITFNGEE